MRTSVRVLFLPYKGVFFYFKTTIQTFATFALLHYTTSNRGSIVAATLETPPVVYMLKQ